MRHLVAAFSIFFAITSGAAQTLETLHSFGTLTNQVGILPKAPLVVGSDGTLYGTTSDGVGGGLLKGAIFAVKTNGSDFRVLKQFTNAWDGSKPRASLSLHGSNNVKSLWPPAAAISRARLTDS